MIVTAALQKYSDRGVFRGLKTARRPGGRYEYTFSWLMQRSFTLSYDPARRVLSFKNLFPHVNARSPMATALREVVAERSTARVPAHKRLDGRRAQASCGIHGMQLGETVHETRAYTGWVVAVSGELGRNFTAHHYSTAPLHDEEHSPE